MSETTPPTGVPGATPEPPKPADAAQKKQTVRISLPPKPAGGPSIRLPAAGAPAAGAAVAAPAASTAAPAAPRPPTPPSPAAAVAAAPSAMAKPAAAAAPAKPAPAAAPRAAAPARASVSGLDIGLAFATVACSLATVAALFLFQPIQ